MGVVKGKQGQMEGNPQPQPGTLKPSRRSEQREGTQEELGAWEWGAGTGRERVSLVFSTESLRHRWG